MRKPISVPTQPVDLAGSSGSGQLRSDLRHERGNGGDATGVHGIGGYHLQFFQYPGDDAIIYSSTHLAGEECPPKADPGLGYVWTLYPSYDIFKASPDGSNLIRLTESDGYDAEGTYAFDGSRIVYTSLASGDLEIWTMDPDGSNKRQLTNRLGYDGGPFSVTMEEKSCGGPTILKRKRPRRAI